MIKKILTLLLAIVITLSFGALFACDSNSSQGNGDGYVSALPFGGDITPTSGTEGLEYKKNSDGTYAVSGIGSASTVKDIVIPSHYQNVLVTRIGFRAFYQTKIESVVIPEGVTEIGERAFERCFELKNVTLSKNINNVGSLAFWNCKKLNYNQYDNALYLGTQDNPYLALINAVFSENDTETTWVVIPTRAVTSCQINADCEVIAGSAFENCKNLTSITIPSKVKTIGSSAFRSCKKITSIILEGAINYIGSYAFFDSGVKTVKIGSSITKIDLNAFSNAPITSFTVSENNQNYSSYDGDLYSKDKKTLIRYASGKTDKSPIIPDFVEKLENWAVQYSNNLEVVVVPETVTYLGNGVFSDCLNMKDITFSNSTAFYGTHIIFMSGIGNSKLANIYFNGTREEWEALKLLFNPGSSTYTVYYLK